MAAIVNQCPICRGVGRTLSEFHAGPGGFCLCCGGEGEVTVLPPSEPPSAVVEGAESFAEEHRPLLAKLAGLDVGAEVTDDAAGLGLTVRGKL